MSSSTSITAVLAAVALAACATGAPESGTSTSTSTAGASAAPPPTAMGCHAGALQQAVLQKINEARQAGLCGDARLGPAKPLVWREALASTASKRAGEIAQRNAFGSVAEVAPRLRQDGYQATSAQETQVAGDFSSDGAAQALLGQQKQCTALLNPAYTDIGAACVNKPGSEFRNYWTVVVAKGTPMRTAMGSGPAAKKHTSARKASTTTTTTTTRKTTKRKTTHRKTTTVKHADKKAAAGKQP